MSANPYHKRYHSDALTGYRGLTLEQRGAYTTILDLLYDSGEPSLPSLERWMAGQLGVSIRKWRALREELAALGKIIVLDDGRITNKRYLRELERVADVRGKRADAGRKGGTARAEKQADADLFDASSARFQREFSAFSTPENDLKQNREHADASELFNDFNGGDQANAKQNSSYTRATPEPESRVKEEDTQPTSTPRNPRGIDDDGLPDPFGDIGKLTARCGRAAGVAVSPSNTRFADQLDAVRSWVDMGLDPDTEIIPALEQDAANSTQTRHSLKYFTPAMARIAARKDAAANGRRPNAETDIRGSRPDPAVDLYRAALRAEEEEERSRRNRQDRGGTWSALPAPGSG